MRRDHIAKLAATLVLPVKVMESDSNGPGRLVENLA
jgi:hypothetical protein